MGPTQTRMRLRKCGLFSPLARVCCYPQSELQELLSMILLVLLTPGDLVNPNLNPLLIPKDQKEPCFPILNQNIIFQVHLP